MKKWLERLLAPPAPPSDPKTETEQDAAEWALRVFPKCC